MPVLHVLLLNQFILFTLVLSRVGGLVMTAPIFGSQSVPMQVRGLLAAAIALLITPTFWEAPLEYPGTTLNYVVLIGGEILVGLVIGLGVQILFTGVQVAGQIIGQLSGMALADVFNPAFNDNSPIFTQILFYVAMAVFVLIDGHRVVMAALLDTFHAIPPGAGGISSSIVETFVTILTQSFIVGIRGAAPVMAALLLSTFVLGLISRTLPQLNIIAVGFGLNSMITLGMLLVSLGGLAWAFQEQVLPVVELLQDTLTSDRALVEID